MTRAIEIQSDLTSGCALPLAPLAREFSDAFGATFDLWQQGPPWISTGPSGEAIAFEPESAFPVKVEPAVLDEVAGAGEPRLIEITSEHSLLFVPVPDYEAQKHILAGAVRSPDRDLLLRFARRLMHEWKLRRQLDALRSEGNDFAQMVTEDLEELTFLRSMVEHLEVSEATLDLASLARTIFPLLCRSMKAECIMLLAVRQDEDGSVRVGKPSVVFGKPVLSEQECVKLVQHYQRHSLEKPFVRNVAQPAGDGQHGPNLRNFIIVPLHKNGRVVGWLSALNRQQAHGCETKLPPWGLSDFEFGTVEASLLTSAASVLATHEANFELFREKEQLLTNVVLAFVTAIDAKDKYTRGHSERVAQFGRRLGAEIGLDEESQQRLYLTGLLHDVGKIGVADATLAKPGKLTEAEFQEIMRHPDEGWGILHGLDQLRYVLPGVLYHHERYDGRGYPDGLAGKNIPLDGRILAVADAYDAMTSDRPYRRGMPQQQAESILRAGAGTQWDPDLIDAFFDALPDIIEIRRSYRPRDVKKRKSGVAPVRP